MVLPATNPVIEPVKTGFATPYSLDALLGETVSGALLTVKATVSVATL